MSYVAVVVGAGRKGLAAAVRLVEKGEPSRWSKPRRNRAGRSSGPFGLAPQPLGFAALTGMIANTRSGLPEPRTILSGAAIRSAPVGGN